MTEIAENLPEQLRELSDRIGTRGVMLLAEIHGGGRLYVPKRMRPTHRLVSLLGFQAAVRLSRAVGGCTIQIPKAARRIRMQRDAEIRALAAKGHSIPALADQFDLTERQIYRILQDVNS